MKAYNFNLIMNIVEVRGVNAMVMYSSGLYCRTQISL